MSTLIVEVCKVDNIVKHPNADRLSIATIKGWNCIVGLDQYKVGDLVVFIPPDAIIPDALIEKYNLEYLKKNGRTGTVKLRGYLSQGLVLDVPEGNFQLGDNVAEVMGIVKFEQPEPKFSVNGVQQVSKKRLNPDFVRYTDIENIKNFQDIFQVGDEVVVTEKVHGCNARYAFLPIAFSGNEPLLHKIKLLFAKYVLKRTHEFVYGSHNVQISGKKGKSFYGEDVWGRIAKKYDLGKIIPKNTIIYGEVYGAGIQDLTYGLNDIDFVVFDIKQNGKYLGHREVVLLCEKLGLPIVPILFHGYWYDGLLEDFTDGKSVVCPKQIREGVVIKAVYEENNPRIGRKILKSVSADYLTRKNGTEYK